MGHQKPRGVVVQREEGVSMVLPCAMVPQIILYGIEGRKCDDCYLSITTGGETTTINGTVRKAEELR